MKTVIESDTSEVLLKTFRSFYAGSERSRTAFFLKLHFYDNFNTVFNSYMILYFVYLKISSFLIIVNFTAKYITLEK